MKLHKWSDLKDAKHPRTPAQRAADRRWVEEKILEMNLRKLRESTGKTQEEVAELAEMSQSELSRAERRADHMVSTLRRVIRAMGGELEVRAVFPDGKQVKLSGV